MVWKIERLSTVHNIANFDCGEPTLNSFLQKHALNNDRVGLGRTFVAVDAGQTRVLGYFTVSTGSVTFNSIPDHARKRLPRYPIPTVHIGRLAVDTLSQGKGLGEALLVEALCKAGAAATSVGVYAVDLIALNDRAKRFYAKYGFIEMLNDAFHMFLPIGAARKLAKIVAE